MKRIIYSILFYVLLMILVVLAKPSFLFTNNSHELKPFGIGDQKTMFSFGVVAVIMAIVSFYLFAIIDMIFSQ